MINPRIPFHIVSVDAALKIITVGSDQYGPSRNFINFHLPEFRLSPGAKVQIFGSPSSDGMYTVDAVLSFRSFRVVEVIAVDVAGSDEAVAFFRYTPKADYGRDIVLANTRRGGQPKITATNPLRTGDVVRTRLGTAVVGYHPRGSTDNQVPLELEYYGPSTLGGARTSLRADRRGQVQTTGAGGVIIQESGSSPNSSSY